MVGFKETDMRMLEHMRYQSQEEKTAFLKMFELKRREPSMQLAMAFYRDAMIFREAMFAYCTDLRLKIDELERRLEKTEKEASE